MRARVLGLEEVGGADTPLVGGKGANLGELSRLAGVRVPAGFCVTTEAYAAVVRQAPALGDLIARSARLGAEDGDGIRALGAELRGLLEASQLPDDVADAIAVAHARLGERGAYAVRSSATAEDLASASFAGQHDSYLDVVGLEALLHHVRRCWASLFTERAIAYRLRHGVDPRDVAMAAVVQRMVAAQAAGVLFTADPVTGNRKVSTIEAVSGLGDALVSGRADADRYQMRAGQVVARAARGEPLLTDEQLGRLEALGRQVEAHFGAPQDLEWCLDEAGLHVVQSRPITTLYPVPDSPEPGLRVYLSVGHQQMMTDALKPLGLSLFQRTALRPMYAAGGRLFVDVTRELSSPVGRGFLLKGMGRHDPLMADALDTLVGRGDVPLAEAASPPGPPPAGPPPLDDDPAVVAELIARGQAAVEELERELATRTGSELLDAILDDVARLKRTLTDPTSVAAIRAAMDATWWLDERMSEWLGEAKAADALSQSQDHNVTSAMGLALLDVADVIRPHPEVIAHLQDADDDGFLEGLLALDGGPEAYEALRAFLDAYGMRCAGEIDLTRTRWSERPALLAPLILGHVARFAPGEGRRRFESGRQAAAAKEQELLERLQRLPDGARKADEARRTIRRLRTFVGYREYPKYHIVSRYRAYKRALLAEADRLVRAGQIRAPEDLFYLTLDELRGVLAGGACDDGLVRRREAEHERNQRLTPPRVLTSDGEVVTGAYARAQLPEGALAGIAVSGGVVEGRARVLRDMAQARLEPGDILVTTFTDPSWTPVFVSIRGLVTEVGGLMTHGAVIAREYGLPAVIGVPDATKRIADGQRIRVNGAEGWVEVLP